MDQLDVAALVDEQRALNARWLAAPAVGSPPAVSEVAALRRQRLYRRDGSLRPFQSPHARDASLATWDGETKVREFTAPGGGVVAHFHGGGWALGSIYEQDALLAGLATQTGTTVVSIDYPLAPEAELPRALEAAEAALCALMESRSGPVAIIGESAGAHVALTCALRLRAKPALSARICAMSLSYGIYDLSMTPSQRAWGEPFLGLSTPWLEWFYALALPGLTRDARSDPALSPLYADLAGLAPTLFSVGAADPLLDDSLFIFQRWLTAGNAGRLDVYPEAPHGFNHQPTGMAAACNRRVAAFLTDAIGRAERSDRR